MKPMKLIAAALGVMLSFAVAGSALAGSGTSPGKTFPTSKGTGVLHLAATQASCGQLRTRCVNICWRRYRPASSEAAVCRGECIADYQACMNSVLYGTKRR